MEQNSINKNESTSGSNITTTIIVIIIIIIILIGVGIVLYLYITNKWKTIICPEGEVLVNGKCLPYDCTTGKKCSDTDPFCGPNGTCVECLLDSDCSYDDKCSSNNVCIPRTCSSSSECRGTELCIDGLCMGKNCITTDDCGDKEACINSKCLLMGESCNVQSDSNDCYGDDNISCTNNICVQCSIDTDCQSGSFCSDNICRPSCKTLQCPSNEICVSEIIGTNISYINQRSVCCIDDGNAGNPCESEDNCGGSAPFCVGGVCSCVQGNNGDLCSGNDDCTSSKCVQISWDPIDELICSTDSQCVLPYGETAIDLKCIGGRCSAPIKICVDETTQCVADYGNSVIIDSWVCPKENPHCVNSQCSDKVDGSECQSLNDCNTSTNGSQLTYYCVNNICSTQAGTYGDGCNDDYDCESTYTCQVDTTISQKKICIPGKIN